MTKLNTAIAETGWVLADGATGTNYFKQGLETGYPPELWNVERPEEVGALHAAFIDAGSQLVLTNSFGGTHHRLRLHEAQDRVGELNHAAARLARVAADAGRDRNGRAVLVAGSIGPTGATLAPVGRFTPGDVFKVFKRHKELPVRKVRKVFRVAKAFKVFREFKAFRVFKVSPVL